MNHRCCIGHCQIIHPRLRGRMSLVNCIHSRPLLRTGRRLSGQENEEKNPLHIAARPCREQGQCLGGVVDALSGQRFYTRGFNLLPCVQNGIFLPDFKKWELNSAISISISFMALFFVICIPQLASDNVLWPSVHLI